MAEENMNDPLKPALEPALMEARITAALEAVPRYTIPAGFAARVASQVPALHRVPLSPCRYGYRTAVVCLVVLFGLMVWIAQRAAGTSIYWDSIESIFCAQFALLAVCLVARESSFFSLTR